MTFQVRGTYPFGEPLRAVEQTDRSPKRVFVLGVYSSAVHATWRDEAGRVLVRALAVASEPTIFWDGTDADGIVGRIRLPAGAGSLSAADPRMNGPSGRALDHHFLEPLGCGRSQSWLCDLVPHTCLNPGQARALEREYVRRMKTHGLPAFDLPPVPKSFGEAARQEAVLAEVEESRAETIVLLGDEPVRHWLKRFDSRWASLGDFGDRDEDYGQPRAVKIADRNYQVVPLAHPRQVAGLGSHSPKWRERHQQWRRKATS